MSRELIVQLDGSLQEPTTPLGRLIITVLRRETSIPFHLLVQRVADELYQRELEDGASVLDIGLFGSSLFIPEVASAIKAGNGTLWQIEKQAQ
jgi:hypothetical protein